MKTTLLFTAATAVALYNITDASSRANGFFSEHQDVETAKAKVTSLRSLAEEVVKDVQSDARRKRYAMKDYGNTTMTWPGNVVFYTFDTSDSIVQKVFKMGVKVWTDSTCIDFVEDKNAQDEVVVVKEVSCWSDNGRAGGEQFLSLGSGCEKMWPSKTNKSNKNNFVFSEISVLYGALYEGIAVHEIDHVLGLLHTMTRYDRDDYIQIVMQNVDSVNIGEIGKISEELTEVYGLSYDYGSVMHYNELSFSINGHPTMIAIDPYHQRTMGSERISFTDIFVVNERHGCNAKCKNSTSAKCANDGFPHPRNCSTCICPTGYGGTLCNQRPPGCGEYLVASREKKTLLFRFGSRSGYKDHFDFCSYMITAPKSTKIEVDLRLITPAYEFFGCTEGGVEIKAQKDQ